MVPDYQNLSDSTVTDKIHLFFLLDNSGSMYGSRIQTLNEAMSNVLRELDAVAHQREVTAIVHVLSFESNITWLCGTSAEHGIEANAIVWNDISTGGSTNTAGAINAILPGLSRTLLGHHAFRPIVVQITDGYSDSNAATLAAIKALDARQKTIRVAIGVDGFNHPELDAFATSGVVKQVDMLGNETDTCEKKLVFPVHEAENFVQIIKDVAVSSLISSKMMGTADGGDTTQETQQPIINITSGEGGGFVEEENPEDPEEWTI